jgi:phage terminase Nu1 subunit (DNA packaging protein)
MSTIITKGDLAARLGVSRPRVSQLVAQGLPVREDGRVELESALSWIAEHTDRSRNVGRARPAATSPRTPGQAAASLPGPQPSADPGHVLLVARARKALAETKRIERLEKMASREVISMAEACEYASHFSRIIRDSALSQADRLTDAILAAAVTGDRDRVYRKIRDDNHRMLTQISIAVANAGLAKEQA